MNQFKYYNYHPKECMHNWELPASISRRVRRDWILLELVEKEAPYIYIYIYIYIHQDDLLAIASSVSMKYVTIWLPDSRVSSIDLVSYDKSCQLPQGEWINADLHIASNTMLSGFSTSFWLFLCWNFDTSHSYMLVVCVPVGSWQIDLSLRRAD